MAEVDTVQIPTIAQPVAGETVATMSKLMKTVGAPTDAKSTATDSTSVTWMQVLKQVSASIQTLVSTGLSITNANPNGAAAGANSAPVVLPSDMAAARVSQDTSALLNGNTALTPKFKLISASSSGVNIVVAAVASKKIRVLAWDVKTNAAVNFKWQSHTTPTDLTGLYYCSAQGDGVARSFNPLGYFESLSGESLDINLSGAVAVGGVLTYVEV